MCTMHTRLSGETGATASTAETDAYEVSTLYVGNLHPGMSLPAVQEMCAFYGAVEHVKVVTDKTSGTSAGYAFVRFAERSVAEAALHALNGLACMGKLLRVNWAFVPGPPKDDAPPQFHIFVGDLAQDVTDALLFNAFAKLQCSQAHVLWDHATGQSKRYGFVTFRSQADGDAAIAAMHGQRIGWSRVRCHWAQHKLDESKTPPDEQEIDRADAVNTNVYVGNIPPEWTDSELISHFSAFGRLAEARLHKRGGYAFVRFEEHKHAVLAIVGTQGASVDGQVLKCSWGKSASMGPAPLARTESGGAQARYDGGGPQARYEGGSSQARYDGGAGVPSYFSQPMGGASMLPQLGYHSGHGMLAASYPPSMLAGRFGGQTAGRHQPSMGHGAGAPPMTQLMRQMVGQQQQQMHMLQQHHQQQQQHLWQGGGGGMHYGGDGGGGRGLHGGGGSGGMGMQPMEMGFGRGVLYYQYR